VDALRTKWREWGFSSEAIDLILSSHTIATHKSYDSHWRRWEKWTARQQPRVETTLPTPEAVANFSAELMRTPGATRRTVVAAVKTTLSLLSDVKSVEKALQTGMRKTRPDRTKHDAFFSLDALWRRMEEQPWATLSLPSKRQRLMVALSIDSLARSSDIVNLFVERVDFAAQSLTGVQGMYIRFAVPKQGGIFSPRLWVESYAHNPELCSVAMMRRWLSETRSVSWQSIILPEKGVDRSFTPVFFNLQRDRLGQALTSECAANIRKKFLASAGIDTTRFTGHSIRGAAVTAALIAGDGTDAWKENLRALGRWTGLACMMRHYCVPIGVLPPRRRAVDYPTSVAAAVRMHLTMHEDEG
jgi:hypothetical protein